MVHTIMLMFISHILIHLIDITTAQRSFRGNACSTGATYESNSTYRRNLDTALSYISSNTNITYGFYNFSVGEMRDTTVNAIALCRGDVARDSCRSCLNRSTYELRRVCPNHKGAIGWSDNCMLRYSNESIFHTVNTRPNFYQANPVDFPEVNRSNELLRGLLDRLRGEATGGGPLGKFASRSVAAPRFQTLYALVQCTPDLSESQCNECLQGVTSDIGDCCFGKRGASLFTPSCNLRYELYRFYNEIQADAPPPPADAPLLQPSPPPPPLTPPPPLPPPPGKKNNTLQIVISVVLPTVIFVILFVCICIFIRKRKQRKKRTMLKENFETASEISIVESSQYELVTIQEATYNFSNTNKLGEGGFGAVYKGRLQNGQEIAVKRLSRNSGQGELEFKTEALLLSKLQHRNLVRLLGFCLEGIEKLLVYEFVPNASLDQFIFDPIGRANLDWDRCSKIIGGVSRGLLYLHEDSRLRIIHRDLKASNVLLDANMNAKISDFGMARLFERDETQGSTSRMVGTFGYMAPEYAMRGHFSVKSDVFSFGVLVLEIISGQKIHCFQKGENVDDLLSYAWKNWQKGTCSNFIDQTLRIDSGSIHDIIKYIHIGLLCVQENVADRPTMASVDLMLNSFSILLPIPLKPAFLMHSEIDPEVPLRGENNSGVMESHQSKSRSSHFSRNSISDLLYPR